MPRSARCSVPHSGVRCRLRPSLVARLNAKAAAPFPNPQCRCDKTQVRKVCIPRAFADLETTLDVILLALLQTISSAAGCSQFPDSSTHLQTRMKYPGCEGAWQSRCCLSCAASRVGESTRQDSRT